MAYSGGSFARTPWRSQLGQSPPAGPGREIIDKSDRPTLSIGLPLNGVCVKKRNRLEVREESLGVGLLVTGFTLPWHIR